MRIDKYLKLTRIIKRRLISKEIIDQGRVRINDKIAKPSALIRTGDVLTLDFSKMTIVVKVLEVDEKIVKKAPDHAYRIISEVKNETRSE